MAFNHRKLIIDPVNITAIMSAGCETYCDTDSIYDGYCPSTCIRLCYPICHTLLPSLIPPSPNKVNKHHTLSLPLMISLAILGATFSLFCTYTIYKYYTAWRGSGERTHPQTDLGETHDHFLDEDHGPFVDHPIWYIRTIGLPPSIINSITVCKYKTGEGLVEGTECSVCLSEFQEDETLRLLPKCNHAFHIPCIDTWLRSHTNCPMCRAGIVASVTASPSPEPNLDHSEVMEETHVVIPENSTDLEESSCELRIGNEEESVEIEVSKEEGGSSGHGQVDEVQPMRRSVSLDSSAASMISLAVNNCVPRQSDENSNTQLVKLKESNLGVVPKRVDVNQSLLRLVGSSSIGRSMSCSGKLFMSRYSRSRK